MTTRTGAAATTAASSPERRALDDVLATFRALVGKVRDGLAAAPPSSLVHAQAAQAALVDPLLVAADNLVSAIGTLVDDHEARIAALESGPV